MLFRLWPRTQEAAAPTRAPAMYAAGMTAPLDACAQRKTSLTLASPQP